MEQYLIDTNVVSDYFSASLPAAGMLLMDTAIDATPNTKYNFNKGQCVLAEIMCDGAV